MDVKMLRDCCPWDGVVELRTGKGEKYHIELVTPFGQRGRQVMYRPSLC